MGEFEALGDAVTGGVVAGAVEPQHGQRPGEADDGHTHETHCLNCGTELAGGYCHACGQHAHVHRTLTAFFHDFLHGVVHFEGKIWRTLPLLAWKPGELTRRYIDGQRATFVSPIALFLFSIFLMFAVVSFTGIGQLAPKEELAAELRADQQKLARLETQRSAAAKSGLATGKLNERIGELRGEIRGIEAVQKGDFGKTSIQTSADLPDWLRDSVGKAAANPDLVAYKLKTNAYKFSWALIPLSVPFVWLLFPFSRRFRLYDHTVFVTYSLCFMTLLAVAWLIFGAVGLAGVAGLLWLIPPIHMYRQLQGTYGLSWRGALWRTVLLTLFALLAISLFAVLLVGVGMFD